MADGWFYDLSVVFGLAAPLNLALGFEYCTEVSNARRAIATPTSSTTDAGVSDDTSFSSVRFFANAFDTTNRGVDLVVTAPLDSDAGETNLVIAANRNDVDIDRRDEAVIGDDRVKRLSRALPHNRLAMTLNHATGDGVWLDSQGRPLTQDADGRWLDSTGQPVSRDDDGVRLNSMARPDNLVLTFEYGRVSIREKDRKRLQDYTDFLRDNAEWSILVEGHTDAHGSDEYNQSLGLRRATSVRDGLLANGIAARRIEVASFGESRPVESSDTPTGRTAKRRAVTICGDDQRRG